jgi:hypothetical protein
LTPHGIEPASAHRWTVRQETLSIAATVFTSINRSVSVASTGNPLSGADPFGDLFNRVRAEQPQHPRAA